MVSMIYELLSKIGYHHPLHPTFTHLTVGLTIAAFIFIVLAFFFKRPKYAQTAKHCAVLALFTVIPTAIFGYLDWQQFYGGSFLFPIKMKLGLALLLVVFLLIVLTKSTKKEEATKLRLMLQLLCVFIVVGLGYYGGELVYGKKETGIPTASATAENFESILAGKKLFEQNCSFCHFTDSIDTKVGPGLKGLFQRDTMTGSNWPVSADSIRKQLKTPFEEMPSFENFTDEEIDTLTDFLESL